jgi:hypothetical protein
VQLFFSHFSAQVFVITGTAHDVTVTARSFASAAEVEWAVKALTNLIQVPCSFSPDPSQSVVVCIQSSH